MAEDNSAIVAEAEAAGETLAKVKTEIGKAVFGQERVIELAMAAVLAGGHALLIGAPGLAKTRLVEAIGTSLGLDNARIQFTKPHRVEQICRADDIGHQRVGGGVETGRHIRLRGKMKYAFGPHVIKDPDQRAQIGKITKMHGHPVFNLLNIIQRTTPSI